MVFEFGVMDTFRFICSYDLRHDIHTEHGECQMPHSRWVNARRALCCELLQVAAVFNHFPQLDKWHAFMSYRFACGLPESTSLHKCIVWADYPQYYCITSAGIPCNCKWSAYMNSWQLKLHDTEKILDFHYFDAMNANYSVRIALRTQ